MEQKQAHFIINTVCNVLGYKIAYTVIRKHPYWIIVKK